MFPNWEELKGDVSPCKYQVDDRELHVICLWNDNHVIIGVPTGVYKEIILHWNLLLLISILWGEPIGTLQPPNNIRSR